MTQVVQDRDPTGPRELAYRLYENAASAWARRRYRQELDRVERFCLFVGYPRSGHSLVGAFLNAHRDAVIAHELDASRVILAGCSRDELYARILARAFWFDLRGNRSNYPYAVPGQWQGRFRSLRVIGDKRGGALTRCIAEHPDFLDRVRSLVRVPLRLVHVVRNPLDNIAAISIWHRMPLEESVEYYLRHCDTTARLDALCGPSELITVRHEELVSDPAAVLRGLCAFLELEEHPGHIDACSSIVYEAPARTRRAVSWPGALVADVEHRAQAYPFLAGYRYELPGGGPEP